MSACVTGLQHSPLYRFGRFATPWTTLRRRPISRAAASASFHVSPNLSWSLDQRLQVVLGRTDGLPRRSTDCGDAVVAKSVLWVGRHNVMSLLTAHHRRRRPLSATRFMLSAKMHVPDPKTTGARAIWDLVDQFLFVDLFGRQHWWALSLSGRLPLWRINTLSHLLPDRNRKRYAWCDQMSIAPMKNEDVRRTKQNISCSQSRGQETNIRIVGLGGFCCQWWVDERSRS